jgi:dethiobiotin synthetase
MKNAIHPRFVVAGTDTDVGKTVFAAALAQNLQGVYWKPLQCGDENTDSKTVAALAGVKILPEAYVLKAPMSPHRAAELEKKEVDAARLTPPSVDAPLIIEGTGGLKVPITRKLIYIDMLQRWQIPVILCTRTALGTINHTLLSVEALEVRSIPVHGLVFIGDDMPDTMQTIAEITKLKVLGRLPFLPQLNKATLAQAFTENFKKQDFVP